VMVVAVTLWLEPRKLNTKAISGTKSVFIVKFVAQRLEANPSLFPMKRIYFVFLALKTKLPLNVSNARMFLHLEVSLSGMSHGIRSASYVQGAMFNWQGKSLQAGRTNHIVQIVLVNFLPNDVQVAANQLQAKVELGTFPLRIDIGIVTASFVLSANYRWLEKGS